MKNSKIWKCIPGYEGKYQASKCGNIRSLVKDSPLILKQRLNKQGYNTVSLYTKNGKKKDVKVHRAIANTFLPLEDGKNDVNHKDGYKTNNQLCNLEWTNDSENMKHAYELGLIKGKKRKV